MKYNYTFINDTGPDQPLSVRRGLHTITAAHTKSRINNPKIDLLHGPMQ